MNMYSNINNPAWSPNDGLQTNNFANSLIYQVTASQKEIRDGALGKRMGMCTFVWTTENCVQGQIFLCISRVKDDLSGAQPYKGGQTDFAVYHHRPHGFSDSLQKIFRFQIQHYGTLSPSIPSRVQGLGDFQHSNSTGLKSE